MRKSGKIYTVCMDKKVIIITGGEEGLGYEIARVLASSHHVVIFGLKQERLDAAAKELHCTAVQCDVTDPVRIATAIQDVIASAGGVDCVINNAGIFAEGNLEDHTIDQIKAVMTVNALGTIFMIRAVIPHMKQNRSGLIVNIVSQSGLNPRPKWSIYAASKWAMTGLTKSLAEELREYGIRVTGVYPSRLKTNLFKNAQVDRDLSNALDPVEVARAIEMLFSLDPETEVTEIGLRSIYRAL